MPTDSPPAAETKQGKLRWYQYRLRMLLLVLPIVAIADYVLFLCGLERVGDFRVSIAVVAITCIAWIGYLGFKLAEHYRFQYSLRSLFVLTTLVAIACSWLTVTIQNEQKRKAAAEAITKAGGSVKSEPGPTWLRKLLRDDTLVRVTDVRLYGNALRDDMLVYLQGLGELQYLNLSGSQVTDGGMSHLRALRDLETLGLGSTEITDAGLVHLQGLSQLQRLWLDNTRVTDAGLVHLRGLHQLKELGLVNTKVTDQGVKKLQQALPNCKILR
jgi:hypothetical protein